MHWSGGSFGYFPTYAIGTIYAAQLFKQLQKESSTIIEELISGNLENIHQWLYTHIHQYGRRYTAEEIIKKSCGKGLDAATYINYLKDKYYELYSI
jgi:carboxypeptidase Taq